jgi:hypothetical protein
MQYFNCYRFGHIAKACQAPVNCHKCDGNHMQAACKRVTGDYYTNYKIVGHKPWQQKYPVWKKEKTKRDLIYQNRPRRFRESVSLLPRTPPAPASPSNLNGKPSDDQTEEGNRRSASSTLTSSIPTPISSSPTANNGQSIILPLSDPTTNRQTLPNNKRKPLAEKEVTNKRRPERPRTILAAGVSPT